MSKKADLAVIEARETFGTFAKAFRKREGLGVRRFAKKHRIGRRKLTFIEQGRPNQERWRMIQLIKILTLSKDERVEMFCLLEFFSPQQKPRSRKITVRHQPVWQL